MSLQRLLVYSPLAALCAVCLAARVASDQTAHRHDAPLRDSMPAASGVQTPRSVEASSADSAKSLRATSLLPRPPADVPEVSGIEDTATADGNEPANGKRTGKSAGKIAADTFNASPAQKISGQKPAAYKLSGQTSLRKPENWTPPLVYGPPLPPGHIQAQKQAHQLRKDIDAGRVTLVMDGRDGEQLEKLERSGVYIWPAPPPNIVVRSERQRVALAGTTENNELLAPQPSRLQLASRGGELERTAANPADDPDFNPCAVPPSPLLLRLLTTLAGHSTPAHPLQILSLLRPPYRMGGYVHVGPANPHSMGLAVDIGAYGGYSIRQTDGEACVAATLALLRDLPPGRYRLGMPKAPEGGWDLPPALAALLTWSEQQTAAVSKSAAAAPKTPQSRKAAENALLQESAAETQRETTTACAISALYGLYASSAKPEWPFFPPPFTQIVANEATGEENKPDGEDVPAVKPSAASMDAKTARSGKSSDKLMRTVLRFQNEAYAPETGLADARLRKALEQARRRGVDIVAMFPDGADHIHIDVRQNP